MRSIKTVLSTVAALIAPHVSAAQADTKPVKIWSDGFLDYVQLETTPGAANAHPANVAEARIADLLLTVKIKDSRGGFVPLFTRDESLRLARAFAPGLTQANAQQDVTFLSTERRGEGLLVAKTAITGRLFVAGEQLHLIVGGANQEYLGKLKVNKSMPPMFFGSRSEGAKLVLRADNSRFPGGAERSDWLALTLADAPAVVQAAPAPTAAAEPAQPAAVAPAARDENFYAQQEQRLKHLAQLRAKKLISEEEYKDKKAEILKDL